MDGQTRNFKFVGNVFKQIHRMGLELQDHWGGNGNNIYVADNVFTDPYQGYLDSFGMSIMCQRATNVTITNNYFRARTWSAAGATATSAWASGSNPAFRAEWFRTTRSAGDGLPAPQRRCPTKACRTTPRTAPVSGPHTRGRPE